MKHKPDLYVTIGASGSGKSTWSKDFIKKNPTVLRVNRDDLRQQLIGHEPNDAYYKRRDVNKIEELVTTIQNHSVKEILTSGLDCILDNTHLRQKYINEIYKNFNHLSYIHIRWFDVDLKEAKRRVIYRHAIPQDIEKYERTGKTDNLIHSVDYIDRQYDDYWKFKKNFKVPQVEYFEPVVQDKNLPKSMLIDADGTLSLFDRTLRNPYDRDFENDDISEPVKDIILNQPKDVKIFIFSGRNSKFRAQTEQFLQKHLPNTAYTLIMRPEDDMRKDDLLKMEWFDKYIKDKFYCKYIVDDRLSVVRAYVSRNLFVFNVNQKNEEF
jgi:predicted kinase